MSRIFSGTSYIHTPANAVYNNLQTLTLAAWIFPTNGSINPGVIIVKDPATSYAAVLQVQNTGGTFRLAGQVNGATGNSLATSTAAIPINTWTHVLMTFSWSGDKKVHLYINGVEVTYATQTTATGVSANDSGSGWFIGDDALGEGIVGDVAEVAVWNEVLSGANITAIAASTVGASSIDSAHLVGYWHLCGITSPEPDATANGDSGTLVGGPTGGPDSPGYLLCLGTSKSHSIDAYILSFTGPIPFDITQAQATYTSGPPTPNQSVGVTVNGILPGDVIVVYTNWPLVPTAPDNPINLGISPSISDNAAGPTNIYVEVFAPQIINRSSFGIGAAQQAHLAVVKNSNSGSLIVSANWSISGGSAVIFPTIYVKVIRNVDNGVPVQSKSSTVAQVLDIFTPIPELISTGPKTATQPNTFAVACCAYISVFGDPRYVPGTGWTLLGNTLQAITGNGGVFADQGNIPLGTPVTSTFVAQFPTPASPNAVGEWLDQMILLNPILGDSHYIDCYVSTTKEGFVQQETFLIPPIIDPHAFLMMKSNLAQPALDFVMQSTTLKSIQFSFINMETVLAKTVVGSYLKQITTLGRGGSNTHNIDALLMKQPISFLNMATTLIQTLQPTGCRGSFPDIAFLKQQTWLVAPGGSVQAPGTNLALSDDWLSQIDAVSAYPVVARFVLGGIPLVVTGFSSGVLSWQTRTRQWLRLVDFEPDGVVISTNTSNRTLPNGQKINTQTVIKQVQDTTFTTVTVVSSTNPNRISTIITEQTKGGNIITRELETDITNGIRNTIEKKTVTSAPPTTENIQPITVTTLDGVKHYQFFGPPNQHWAGGDAEGTSQTATAVQIVPGSLNGETVSPQGYPILARITDSTVNTPDGKQIQTHTEEVGIQGAGTTQTDTEQDFNGIQTTTIKTVTNPDGSQTITKTVQNALTGDSTSTTIETATDENGLVTQTTTAIESKTFTDPVSGVLRTTSTKTVTIVGPTGTTVDTTESFNDNFEDDLIQDKIKVYFIQEFTINVVIDRFSKEALEEIAIDHQRSYAIAELIGQQLGNMNLSWLLRNNLISQFNQALNCIEPVQLQALGKTYQVTFAPSASSFRAKYVAGTLPAVFELQMIVQERSDLVTGLRGF